ncbi:hypothetical protein KY333_03190 [Candidatus Woesearchaeota archaeon]|nr:hypothetical protein [Candidatus Woesearchaeota archaeon]MBW2994649.1 hypothetical protein [Candidatus Woesearchaeota archaeon]
MNEKMLLITALTCIVVGLPILYAASQFVSSDDPRVLTELMGVVERVTAKEKVTIISVKPIHSIPVVSFDNLNVKKGEKITVTGRLESYNGKIEFIADELT